MNGPCQTCGHAREAHRPHERACTVRERHQRGRLGVVTFPRCDCIAYRDPDTPERGEVEEDEPGDAGREE